MVVVRSWRGFRGASVVLDTPDPVLEARMCHSWVAKEGCHVDVSNVTLWIAEELRRRRPDEVLQDS